MRPVRSVTDLVGSAGLILPTAIIPLPMNQPTQIHPHTLSNWLPPLILAPTRFELKTIRAELSNLGIPASFDCIGVGPGAVWRWAQSSASTQTARSPAGRTVILAGVAGALDPAFAVGSVRSASMIIGAGSEFSRPSPSYMPPLQSSRTTVIASVDMTCSDSKRKQALRKQTGAGMVDMESAAFAALATERGWNWGVLRAVSDDHATEIPKWMNSLVHNDGSLQVATLATSILFHPSRIARLAAVGASARRALRELSGELAILLTKRHPRRRTLIFGGTFDPPHRRHAEMVAAAAKFLDCDRVVIIPTGHSPLRDGHDAAPNADRLEMARRAFGEVHGAVIDPREMNRSGESFTVDTLREIAGERSANRDDIVLLIGADQALQFDRWKSWREIDHNLATIAIVPRPPLAAAKLATQLAEKFSRLGEDGERWEIAVLPFESVDLSATMVRNRLRANEGISDLVTPAVEDWIRNNGLYA